MNLNQVQVFCAVAKHLSFSMAAEELFITQPAVSQQVKALERQLNVKLFERVGHKLFLTESGEAVGRVQFQRHRRGGGSGPADGPVGDGSPPVRGRCE